MKSVKILVLLGLLTFCGCQKNHKQNDATEQWNKTRMNLAYNLAQNQYQTGQYERALASVAQILDQAPENAIAWQLQGQIYFELLNNNEAIRSFEKAIALNPAQTVSYYWLGRALENTARRSLALDYYQKALDLEPDNLSYCLAVVELLANQGQSIAAFDLITHQLQNQPNQPILYAVAGDILRDSGKNRDAAIMYRQALAYGSDDMAVEESLAMVLIKDQQYIQARQLLLNIEEKMLNEGRFIPLWVKLALGDCYAAQGDYHQARRSFEYVSLRDESNPAIWLRLAQVAMKAENHEQAKLYADKALTIQKSSDGLLILAFIALEQQQYEIAQKTLIDLLQIDAGNATAYCLLGLSYQHQGNNIQALQYYNRAAKMDPQSNWPIELLSACQDVIKAY